MIPEVLDIVRFAAIEGGADGVAEARSKHKTDFPAKSIRRMTHLGILSGLCLQRLKVSESVPIVYASKFAESRSLEDFIDSFPTPSPALFQSSIHPSAVEQALIGRQQAIQSFYPITCDVNLAGRALETLFLLPQGRGIVLAGEERGTWLRPHKLASDIAFACALQTEPSGSEQAVGRLSLDRSTPVNGNACLETEELAESIRSQTPIQAPSLALNAWIRLQWL